MKSAMISSIRSSPILYSVLLIGLFIPKASTSLLTCSSDRPGSETHRTLYVPSKFMPKTKEEQKWAAVLCCIYTHVEKYDNSADKSYLETYDGNEDEVGRGDFLSTAKKVKEDICKMYMGKQDCSNKRKCMEDAMEDPKTTFPSQNPTTDGTSPLLLQCVKKAKSISRRQMKKGLKGYRKSIKECMLLSGADRTACIASKKEKKKEDMQKIKKTRGKRVKKCGRDHGRYF
eukprot:CAMPEP_0194279656 /NCGR_PEP_ID=MMETSP0169-20130528/14050_1 /TAXON_ID=218684 /ORGANISM="Corethron pennatum, Strain L29A3" /LENGTH=229 /DNA_ID=CAMNT_0039024103 /DNA_START=12 /DNA_END=701 /DNA_ORIENTATION=-